MITLQFRKTKPNRFPLKIDEVLHLKVVETRETRPGWWRLIVDDVTPLPGAEPTSYACFMCGIVEDAKPDGCLPEGWTRKEFGDGVFFAKGSHFVCGEEFCQNQRMCQDCGCTDDHACDPPCYWVDDNLCSACAPKGRIPKDLNVLPIDQKG